MATEKRNLLKEIMSLAWSFARKNGYSMSEALKCAWTNIKLRALLHKKVVEFKHSIYKQLLLNTL